MTPSPRVWCVVPAAGIGKRFGSSIPKQYLALGTKTVFEHTLSRLLSVNAIERIVLAVDVQDTRIRQFDISQHPKVTIVEGGAERCHSVLNGLRALQHCASADDWVLVHDVARPCVRCDDIQQLIDTLLAGSAQGGLLATPVRDTMKRSDHHGKVTETVNREQLWHALTPQMFPFTMLLAALERAIEQQALVTDEASAMELLGHQPQLVQGHSDNIKITHPQDLKLAELFISQQEED